MSTVVLQMGQCGNQIGTQLFSVLYTDAQYSCKHDSRPSSFYYQSTIDRYFYTQQDSSKLSARSVLIDMEPKVIESSFIEAKREGQWSYDLSSVYKGHKGSGNNWAHGFCQHGPKGHDGILNALQHEVEKCDNLESFLILMSVAGGTGSGLGTYVTQLLCDEYPSVTVVNPIVWPYASGEVIVQNYNALLTTANLYSLSDALILLPNDHLHKVCSKLLHLKEIGFKDLNKVASHVLASILQPAVPYDSLEYSKDNFISQWCSLSDICTALTPHKDYRLLSIKSVPQMPEQSHAFTNYLWSGLLKYLCQMVRTDSVVEEGMDWSPAATSSSKGNKCLSNLFIFRGENLSQLDFSQMSCYDSMYSSQVPPFMRQSIWCSPNPFNRYEKSCTVLSNGQSCLNPLSTITSKAWRMYSARAYVHQYAQFGMNEETFMESFVKIEQVLKNYSSLS